MPGRPRKPSRRSSSRQRALVALVALAVALGACRPEEGAEAAGPAQAMDGPEVAGPDRAMDGPEAAGPDRATASGGATGPDALRARDERPSIVLVVVDTLRADAVSAYGEVEGTTPTMDALAEAGLRYAHAYAPAPWTVSSHASLFTGLRVDEHGVGLDGVFRVDDGLAVLAEDFRDAGYETAGFAENSLVGPDFGFDRGFDHFESTDVADVMREQAEGGDAHAYFGLARRVRAWAASRDRSKPYLLFVNLMDAHDPYLVRPRNPWVPADADETELRFVARAHEVSTALCRRLPPPRDLAVLRGLYHGDVAAADAKLRDVLAALGSDAPADRRLTIVTSDHGEHLGEHGLMGHRFSVRNPVLQIPMIVTGLRDAGPGVIDAPVELRGLRAALGCWALGRDCPGPIPIEQPTSHGGSATAGGGEAPIVGVYSDESALLPEPVRERLGLPEAFDGRDRSRAACEPEAPVFGRMVSWLRFPTKLVWVEGHEPSLHDLSWDPAERSDIAGHRPERAAAMRAELERFVDERIRNRAPADPGALSPEAARALKSLGYAE